MPKKIFNDIERKFIEDNVQGKYVEELKEIFNKKFNRNITTEQIINYKKDHKLKSNVKVIFTEEEKQFIKQNAKGKFTKELTTLLNEEFNKEFTYNQVRKYMLSNGIKSGKTTRMASNKKPVGYEYIAKDGYTRIKVTEPNKWEKKQLYLYKKYKGIPPKGFDVTFLDGNKNNFDLDNLIAIDKKTKLIMGRCNLFSKDSEVTKLGVMVAQLRYENYNLIKNYK